jgi:ABC-type multidrug transport system ATPase subunit
VLSLVDLADVADRRVGSYSFGMRQRLGLAAALLGDPATLVLDEPINGLDPQGTRWLRRLLGSLAREGRTILVSSHLLTEMSEVADDVAIVNKRRLLRQSALADLVAAGHRLEDVFLDLTEEDIVSARSELASPAVGGWHRGRFDRRGLRSIDEPARRLPRVARLDHAGDADMHRSYRPGAAR